MMLTTTISTRTLRLPKDIKAPEVIQIHGKLTGAFNEVVVVKHLRRQIYQDAYVCHITDGVHGRGIYDMPDFHFIKEGSPVTINRRGDINYTMACAAEAVNWLMKGATGFGLTNWLF